MTYAFLNGGARMAALIREFPWKETPLGPIEGWPSYIRHTVSLMVRSDVPMVALFGEEGIMIYNDAYSGVAGARHPHLLGSPVRQGWPEVAEFNDNVMKVCLSGKTLSYKDQELTLYRTGQAEQVWMNLDYSPVLGDDGLPAAVLAIVVETTAKVRAERHIESERYRLRQMFGQAPGFICTLQGPEHVFDFVNEAYNRLFHRPEFIGKPVREVFPELQGQGFFELLDQVYRTGERYIARNLPARIRRIETGSEELLYLDFVYAPMFDEAGKVVGIFCEGQDVTEAMAAQAALREADHRKDEFIATLAHELRNPLAPLYNAIQLLKSGAGRVQPSDLYEMMDRQIAHLVRLVDDLLEISRITRGTFELQKQRINLSDVVHNALDTSQPLMTEKKHTVRVQTPAEPVWTDGDPVRLAQIFSNLLNNAARYSAPGSQVTVKVSASEKSAMVQVIDQGKGFSAEQAETLFRMFARGENSVGLGVGLALSRRLAEMHAGTVSGESAGPEKGATFTVQLPLAAAPEAAEPAVPPEADLEKLRVLVVDDNLDAANTTSELLKFLGAEVEVAGEGKEALDMVASFDPEAVLLDIGMPGMSGYEVAEILRSRYASRRLAIIGLSGWGQEGDRLRGKESGFDHHLVKPADIGQLQELLLAIARERHAAVT